jgi:hypothetical protein
MSDLMSEFDDLGEDMGMDLFSGTQELPAWVAGALRVEDGALVGEMVAPVVEGTPSVEPKTSDVIDHLPATTIAFVEYRDLATTTTSLLDQYGELGFEDTIEEFDQMLGLIGGIEGITSWMGDGAVALTADGDELGVAVVVATADASASDGLVASLNTMLALGGAGLGIEARQESYAGESITIIDLTAVAGEDLADVPFAPELAYVATDDIVVVGMGVEVVRQVLDASTGTSIVDDEAFSSLLARVGVEGTALAYVDVDAAREALEDVARSEGEDLGDYDADYRPYLEPFGAVIASATVDGGLSRATIILAVD